MLLDKDQKSGLIGYLVNEGEFFVEHLNKLKELSSNISVEVEKFPDISKRKKLCEIDSTQEFLSRSYVLGLRLRDNRTSWVVLDYPIALRPMETSLWYEITSDRESYLYDLAEKCYSIQEERISECHRIIQKINKSESYLDLEKELSEYSSLIKKFLKIV